VNIGNRDLGSAISAVAGGPGALGSPAAPQASAPSPISMPIGAITVQMGTSTSTAQEVGGQVRNAVRDEIERMLRMAQSDMGR